MVWTDSKGSTFTKTVDIALRVGLRVPLSTLLAAGLTSRCLQALWLPCPTSSIPTRAFPSR